MERAMLLVVAYLLGSIPSALLRVPTLGSTEPASIRAIMDWLTPARSASSACVIENFSRIARISVGVGICMLLLKGIRTD